MPLSLIHQIYVCIWLNMTKHVFCHYFLQMKYNCKDLYNHNQMHAATRAVKYSSFINSRIQTEFSIFSKRSSYEIINFVVYWSLIICTHFHEMVWMYLTKNIKLLSFWKIQNVVSLTWSISCAHGQRLLSSSSGRAARDWGSRFWSLQQPLYSPDLAQFDLAIFPVIKW